MECDSLQDEYIKMCENYEYCADCIYDVNFPCQLMFGYDKGRIDTIETIIKTIKNEYYCDEELCGESIECNDCIIMYLEKLKAVNK